MHRLWTGIACGFLVWGLIALREPSAIAQTKPDGSSTVWLVRHGEKQQGKDGVWVLSKAGWERAQDLANLLKNKSVRTIVTTSEVRTGQTAEKVAQQEKLQVQPVKYPQPTHVAQVVKAVRDAEPNVLIVGHSDTVLKVIAALRGQKDQKQPTLDEFNRIFSVEVDSMKNVASCAETTYGAPKVPRKTKNC